MVSVNWTSIRPLDGSQRGGFEELCAQLAGAETPVSAKFDRTGNPDAGVECYCTLADGDEWGWQAKYFVDALGSSQWDQLDRSVRTALEKHPNLVRYLVCIPRNRSDPRIPGRQSAMETWDRHVRKWKGWARNRGMQVDFEWWGSSELLDRLSQPQHIGRLYYWFGRPGFDESWFSGRLEEARRVAGPRYTPEVHVELDIVKRLDLFARADSAVDGLRSYAVGVRDALLMLRYPASPDAGGTQRYELGELVAAGNRILDEFATLDIGPAGDVQMGRIVDRIAEVQPLAEEAYRAVEKLGQEYTAQQYRGDENIRQFANPHAQVVRDIARFQREIHHVSSQLGSADSFINRQALVLTGRAGNGEDSPAVRFCPPASGCRSTHRPADGAAVHRYVRTMEPGAAATRYARHENRRVRWCAGSCCSGVELSSARDNRCPKRGPGLGHLAEPPVSVPGSSGIISLDRSRDLCTHDLPK